MASRLHTKRLKIKEYREEYERVHPLMRGLLMNPPRRRAAINGASREAINTLLVRAACKPNTQLGAAAIGVELMLAAGRRKLGGGDAATITDWAREVAAPRMELALIGKIEEVQAKLGRARSQHARSRLSERLCRLRVNQTNLRNITAALTFTSASPPASKAAPVAA